MSYYQPPSPPPTRSSSNAALKWLLALVSGCLVMTVCLACLVVAGAAGFILVSAQLEATPTTQVAVQDVTPRPVSTTPAPSLTPAMSSATPAVLPSATVTPTLTPTLTTTATPGSSLVDLIPSSGVGQQPVNPQMMQHLENFYSAEFPVHDYYESAARLSSFDLGERTILRAPAAVGDVRSFFVEGGSIDATLVNITEHTYFWVEEGLNLDIAALRQAAERFEQDYYPTLVNLIGPEWNPGVDGDPHFSVLHLAGNMDNSDELGYFNSGDEYPTSFYIDSNEQEIIYLNMGNLSVGEDLYYGTLVHEFQHLAQWYVDGNEERWMDEGLAQMAELYNGLETAAFRDYLLAPDTPLNSWDFDGDRVYAHYSASYLFMVYIWEQLGDTAMRELARHPANGLSAVRSVLAGYRPDLTLEQFLANWAVANLLDSPAAGEAYHYRALQLSRIRRTEEIDITPYESTEQLDQFGVHYIDLDLSGTVTISFAGDTLGRLSPPQMPSGSQMWYAPPVDATSATLTGEFDLSGLNRATLNFSTWFDLEEDYDFAYVSISTDGGQSWDLLRPEPSIPGDYGPAFTGHSEDYDWPGIGWKDVSIPLNNYVGRPVLIRFEVLTDAAVLESGFAIDDLAIPELGYESDVEGDTGGWVASGFVQTGRWLPQQWSVQLVQPGVTPQVMPLDLDDFNQGRWTFDLDSQGAVLVIMPQTPFVSEPADYWLQVE